MAYTTNTPSYSTSNTSYQVLSYTDSTSYGATYSPKKRGVCTCNGTGCRGTCRS